MDEPGCPTLGAYLFFAPRVGWGVLTIDDCFLIGHDFSRAEESTEHLGFSSSPKSRDASAATVPAAMLRAHRAHRCPRPPRTRADRLRSLHPTPETSAAKARPAPPRSSSAASCRTA